MTSKHSNRETKAGEEAGKGGGSMDRDSRNDRQVQLYNNLATSLTTCFHYTGRNKNTVYFL